VSHEVRYYLSSLAGPRVARILNNAVRAHWGIETSLHWTLDVAFREDESRVRTGHAAHNLALLRRIALTLLQHASMTRCGITADSMSRRLRDRRIHEHVGIYEDRSRVSARGLRTCPLSSVIDRPATTRCEKP
jgi:hypothetical protein